MAFTGQGQAGKPFSPFTVNATQAQANQPPTSVASFNFGGATAPASFGIGSGVTGTQSAPQLSFTAPTPSTTTSLFSFGGPGGAASTPATTPSQFSLGGSLGTPAAATSTPSINFGIGTASTTAPAVSAPGGGGILGLTQGGKSLTPFAVTSSSQVQSNQPFSSAASFNSAGPSSSTSFGVSSATPQLSFAAPASTPATTSLFSFSGAGGTGTSAPAATATTTTTTSQFSLGGTLGTPAATSNPSINFGLGTASTTATTAGTAGGADASTTQLTTGTTTTQSSSTNVSRMNFRQLQEAINKWMLDLQDQEKQFLEQATKVNARDMTLISNGDKIAKLNDAITKVKGDHTRLEHALDYLKNQQQEFEAFLEPLEAGLPMSMPVEPEREHLYSLTDNVDTQLQQMSEDLKEVIRHINESNKTVDKNDPISQILRILNEHTDALQWVEDNANQVRRSLDDVSKQHQLAKKEHERSLRMMFK